MSIIDRINNITFWCIRLLPIGVICMLTFKYHVFGIETLILEALILAEYYLMVIVKFPKYEIAEGSLALLLFQLSIVVYAISELNIVTIQSSIGVRLLFVLILATYLYLTYLLFKGFVIQKKDETNDDISLPISEDYVLTEESKALMLCFEEIDNIQQAFEVQRERIDSLSVPIPQESAQENSNVCVDYIKSLTDLPTQYPALASLEQFYGIMAANQNWNEIFDSLQTALGDISTDVGHYALGWKSVLSETGHKLAEYAHHPDPDTTSDLLSNLSRIADNVLHSPATRYGFNHAAENLGGVPFYIVKKFSSVLAKSSYETFADTAHIHEMNEEFLADIHDVWDELFSDVTDTVNVDVFSPDFDGSARFPFISTAIEAIKLADKWTDGDVDMVSAAEKSAVRITGTASGAYIGSAIGTLICPGVGTAIGAMVGGWLGRRAANDINRQELDRLQSEYESEYERLLQVAETAKRNIENTQRNTFSQMEAFAISEQEKFELKKNTNPFEELNSRESLYVVNLIIRQYLIYLFEKQKTNGKLLQFIPSKIQIRFFPKESLKLMLSSYSVIKESVQEDEYYNYNLIMEVCLGVMLEKVVLYRTVQCVWFTEMFASYREAVSNILVESNKYMEEYVRCVAHENNNVYEQKRKVDEAERRVRDEARTL